jgi:hypothetical protein
LSTHNDGAPTRHEASRCDNSKKRFARDVAGPLRTLYRYMPIPPNAASPSKRRTTCYRWLPRRVFVSVPAPFPILVSVLALLLSGLPRIRGPEVIPRRPARRSRAGNRLSAPPAPARQVRRRNQPMDVTAHVWPPRPNTVTTQSTPPGVPRGADNSKKWNGGRMARRHARLLAWRSRRRGRTPGVSGADRV